MHISVAQALDIWSDLENCRRNEHSFGSNTAEIYAYRLMPSNPSYMWNRDSSLSREDFHLMEQAAGRALREILVMFGRKYGDIRIQIEEFRNGKGVWTPLYRWNLRGDFPLAHRVQVRVVPGRKRKNKPQVSTQSYDPSRYAAGLFGDICGWWSDKGDPDPFGIGPISKNPPRQETEDTSGLL